MSKEFLRKNAKYLLGSILVFALFAGTLLLKRDSTFGGADVAGIVKISEINPEYKPWFSPLWKPQPETESMLFALQAAIGASVIGYFFGYERARKKFDRGRGRGK